MKNLEQLKKDFEREFLEDDLGNNFAFTNKDNKVLINYEELWNWITKNFCPVEPEVSQENGGHLFNNQKENKMKNTPVDDTFIYKIVLQDTVVDEQKEERFVLARDFNDAVQLACEMCEANDYVVIQTTEIGYVDYCTSKIAEYFSRFSG